MLKFRVITAGNRLLKHLTLKANGTCVQETLANKETVYKGFAKTHCDYTPRLSAEATDRNSLLPVFSLKRPISKQTNKKLLLKYSWFTMLCLVSASDSVIHICTVYHILSHCGSSQDIDYSALCYTGGHGCLPIN